MTDTKIIEQWVEASVVAPAPPGSGYTEADQKAVLDDYLTEADLTRELDKSKRTLERWRRLRVGPIPTIVGNRILYSVADVRIWLRAQRREAAEGQARESGVVWMSALALITSAYTPTTDILDEAGNVSR